MPEQRYREFVEYAGPERAAAGRQRAARPRRDARVRTTASACSRRSSLAAARARARPRTRPTSRVRETGHAVEPRGGARLTCRAAARRRPSRRYAEWEAFVERMVARPVSAPTTRASGGTCARIRSSGRSRCASPDQPTSLERTGGVRRAAAGLCAWALDAPAAALRSRRSAASTRRTAGPRRASGRTGSSIHPDRDEGRSTCAALARASFRVALRAASHPDERVRGRPAARGRPRRGPAGGLRGSRRAVGSLGPWLS